MVDVEQWDAAIEETYEGVGKVCIANHWRCKGVGDLHAESQPLQAVHDEVRHPAAKRVASNINGTLLRGTAACLLQLLEKLAFHGAPHRIVTPVHIALGALRPVCWGHVVLLLVPDPIGTCLEVANAPPLHYEAALVCWHAAQVRVCQAFPPGNDSEVLVPLTKICQVHEVHAALHHGKASWSAPASLPRATVPLHSQGKSTGHTAGKLAGTIGQRTQSSKRLGHVGVVVLYCW
mmetsp:Transcript_46937/g.135721  ORF Transcript_46937/g.135721 Transcript_46937/m.135721 type:complete len:234 (+) Transcript_46937:801-1502(+)